MPIYKNQDTGTWYVICWYTHWTGERKQKCKRGFPTKKAASEWERQFLMQKQANIDMSFEAFYELYAYGGLQRQLVRWSTAAVR